jgi:hypothetical protein
MQRLPNRHRLVALTLGHVILAVDAPAMQRLRAHERVHVRQYELWGPFFGPAYLLESLWQTLRGAMPTSPTDSSGKPMRRADHFSRNIMINKPAALGTENERSGGAPCSCNRLIGPEVARPNY